MRYWVVNEKIRTNLTIYRQISRIYCWLKAETFQVSAWGMSSRCIYRQFSQKNECFLAWKKASLITWSSFVPSKAWFTGRRLHFFSNAAIIITIIFGNNHQNLPLMRAWKKSEFKIWRCSGHYSHIFPIMHLCTCGMQAAKKIND